MGLNPMKDHSDTGVGGVSNSGTGVDPMKDHSDDPLPNLAGVSDAGPGVEGTSNSGPGIRGFSTSGSGVEGFSTSGKGVYGTSTTAEGVWGESQQSRGVYGVSTEQAGVAGESQHFDGVHGKTHSAQHAGVAAVNEAGWWGLWVQGGGLLRPDGTPAPAGRFEGNVEVNGDVTLVGADCAEEFDIAETAEIEPGTVMVLNHHGALHPSQQAYDKKVAGVISGAGDYKPGLILDKKESSVGRLPIALVGKVYCKVDAQYGSIEVGDLLTSSHTPGHAMKAEDPLKAFGAVIGKALRPLHEGQALIPVLIALQ